MTEIGRNFSSDTADIIPDININKLLDRVKSVISDPDILIDIPDKNVSLAAILDAVKAAISDPEPNKNVSFAPSQPVKSREDEEEDDSNETTAAVASVTTEEEYGTEDESATAGFLEDLPYNLFFWALVVVVLALFLLVARTWPDIRSAMWRSVSLDSRHGEDNKNRLKRYELAISNNL